MKYSIEIIVTKFNSMFINRFFKIEFKRFKKKCSTNLIPNIIYSILSYFL